MSWRVHREEPTTSERSDFIGGAAAQRLRAAIKQSPARLRRDRLAHQDAPLDRQPGLVPGPPDPHPRGIQPGQIAISIEIHPRIGRIIAGPVIGTWERLAEQAVASGLGAAERGKRPARMAGEEWIIKRIEQSLDRRAVGAFDRGGDFVTRPQYRRAPRTRARGWRATQQHSPRRRIVLGDGFEMVQRLTLQQAKRPRRCSAFDRIGVKVPPTVVEALVPTAGADRAQGTCTHRG